MVQKAKDFMGRQWLLCCCLGLCGYIWWDMERDRDREREVWEGRLLKIERVAEDARLMVRELRLIAEKNRLDIEIIHANK